MYCKSSSLHSEIRSNYLKQLASLKTTIHNFVPSFVQLLWTLLWSLCHLIEALSNSLTSVKYNHVKSSECCVVRPSWSEVCRPSPIAKLGPVYGRSLGLTWKQVLLETFQDYSERFALKGINKSSSEVWWGWH